ncbi:TPA: alpha/beta fold hydrolase [Aeromonas hydrophila]|uniref:alpha/beta fold hydrolase n=1 Tax=Aeromonas hydrophila TaxID=644 RepID=UPI00227AD7E7|nr:alpha/beta fold hydrolase [Aeromonas sp. BC14]WAF93343.1 lysophospholipase [Aeromonas sp. BC14]HEA3130938.1 alpha/beta fold hydrolase [Aeromonas hydrophila]
MELLQQSLFIPCGAHRLHVRHIQPRVAVHGEPILMVHGAIENGRIFYTESGKGLACFLARNGYQVYVADLRGRGLSTPAIAEQAEHGQHELITEDLPALHRWIAGRHAGFKLHWMAHSWGGVIMASTLVRFPELAEQVASLVFFGTKRGVSVQNPERWLKVDLIWNRLAPWLARRNGFLAARSLKIGADDEPLRYLQETIPWVKCGPWQDPSDGFAYDEAAARVNWPPLWMISAKADKVLGHPTDVRRFSAEMGSAARHTRLGRDNGNRLDYDHINMLTAPQAQEDHFPQILEWLLNPQAA